MFPWRIKTTKQQLEVTGRNSTGTWLNSPSDIYDPDGAHSLGLKEKLLVERFVFPSVSPSPTAMAAPIKMARVATRFKCKIQQMVQINLLGARELGRAELCPLSFCYLRKQTISFAGVAIKKLLPRRFLPGRWTLGQNFGTISWRREKQTTALVCQKYHITFPSRNRVQIKESFILLISQELIFL